MWGEWEEESTEEEGEKAVGGERGSRLKEQPNLKVALLVGCQNLRRKSTKRGSKIKKHSISRISYLFDKLGADLEALSEGVPKGQRILYPLPFFLSFLKSCQNWSGSQRLIKQAYALQCNVISLLGIRS